MPIPDSIASAGLLVLPCLHLGTFRGTVQLVICLLKHAVNRIGDLADDGKPNDSFKP